VLYSGFTKACQENTKEGTTLPPPHAPCFPDRNAPENRTPEVKDQTGVWPR